MMLSTILLIINFLFLFFKESPLISFWWFIFFYPVEILLYTALGFSWFKIFGKLF